MYKNELRGKAIIRYGSVSHMAESMGMSYCKLNRIISGVQDPTASDIKRIHEALDLSASEVMRLFLS